jgi:hypothetical protein
VRLRNYRKVLNVNVRGCSRDIANVKVQLLTTPTTKLEKDLRQEGERPEAVRPKTVSEMVLYFATWAPMKKCISNGTVAKVLEKHNVESSRHFASLRYK